MAIFGNKAQGKLDGAVIAVGNAAQKRAAKLSTQDLNAWGEAVAMNTQANITGYLVTRNTDHLHEALVMAESLPGIIREMLSRA